MSRFSGKIGIAVRDVEVRPGVFSDINKEENRTGYVTRQKNRTQSNESSVNDDIISLTTISIIADGYMVANIYNIIYVEYNGIRWKVKTRDIEYPRILLTLGGVYNGL